MLHNPSLYFNYISIEKWLNAAPCPSLPFSKDVNYEELARCTDDFNGAQLKAVCVESVSQMIFVSRVRFCSGDLLIHAY